MIYYLSVRKNIASQGSVVESGSSFVIDGGNKIGALYTALAECIPKTLFHTFLSLEYASGQILVRPWRRIESLFKGVLLYNLLVRTRIELLICVQRNVRALWDHKCHPTPSLPLIFPPRRTWLFLYETYPARKVSFAVHMSPAACVPGDEYASLHKGLYTIQSADSRLRLVLFDECFQRCSVYCATSIGRSLRRAHSIKLLVSLLWPEKAFSR